MLKKQLLLLALFPFALFGQKHTVNLDLFALIDKRIRVTYEFKPLKRLGFELDASYLRYNEKVFIGLTDKSYLSFPAEGMEVRLQVKPYWYRFRQGGTYVGIYQYLSWQTKFDHYEALAEVLKIRYNQTPNYQSMRTVETGINMGSKYFINKRWSVEPGSNIAYQWRRYNAIGKLSNNLSIIIFLKAGFTFGKSKP
jgi:hypothetical protein